MPLVALLAAAAVATASPAAPDAPAAGGRRSFTLLAYPFTLIPNEHDGVRAWRLDLAGELRLDDDVGVQLAAGAGPQERQGTSWLLFTAGGQARYYFHGSFERGFSLAAEALFVGSTGAGSSGANAVSLAALVGYKQAFGLGFTLDAQLGVGDLVMQSQPGALWRSPVF